MKLAFIGAGKIATAIAGGLVENRVFKLEDLAAADVSPDARAAFEQKTGIPCAESATDVLETADIILLAVKPQDAQQAVQPLGPKCGDRLIISIAAGLQLEKLCKWFNSQRVVRVMPNTPALVSRGTAVFACADGISDADRDIIQRIFGAVGIVTEMDEEKMDAVTAVSGSGPAYVFEAIQGFVDAAVSAGLPADQSLELVTQTFSGAAEMVARGCGTPDELRDAVTSPGGTTAAGLKVMKERDFRGLLKDVVKAATERSIELGKE